MFVDDIGIFVHNLEENYRRICEAIRTYEECLGAKLNEKKSEFIPLTNFTIPQWILDSGNKVLWAGEVTKYLGCPIGMEIKPIQVLDFLLGKVRKRLRHWLNILLSFPSRVTLVKHVLRAIPVYSFMVYLFL